MKKHTFGFEVFEDVFQLNDSPLASYSVGVELWLWVFDDSFWFNHPFALLTLLRAFSTLFSSTLSNVSTTTQFKPSTCEGCLSELSLVQSLVLRMFNRVKA